MSEPNESYEDLMERSWDEIPEAMVVPVGTYRLRGIRAKFMPAKGDKNDCFLFVYAPKEAWNDVDADELAALGDYDITQNRCYARLWVETAKDWDNVRNHLKKHGVDPAGRSIKESLTAFEGTEVIAWLDQRSYTNSVGENETENDPKQFAPTDD